MKLIKLIFLAGITVIFTSAYSDTTVVHTYPWKNQMPYPFSSPNMPYIDKFSSSSSDSSNAIKIYKSGDPNDKYAPISGSFTYTMGIISSSQGLQAHSTENSCTVKYSANYDGSNWHDSISYTGDKVYCLIQGNILYFRCQTSPQGNC